jgi:ribosomal protein S18 acetylase RimI-like enzyme
MNHDRLIETMTAAFLDDPLYRWLYRNPDTRPQAVRDNVRLTLTLVADRGEIVAGDDDRAVALWTAPGLELLDDPAPFLELLQRWAPDRIEQALQGMAACQQHADPADQVLHVLAVHPARQGRGIAVELVRPTLQELDEKSVCAYLESTNPRNLTFYRRQGFAELADVRIPGAGPVMRPMRRPPSVG